MTIRDQMLARKGLTEATPRRPGGLFRKNGIQDTEELRRIMALPRRQWQDDANEMADILTRALKRPGGTMVLRPVQAAALTEAYDNRGALLMIRVSGGKTLISFLLPEVFEAERPLLVIPANLRDKTELEWYQLQEHWKLPKVRTESYEMLGREHQAEYLYNYKPDLLVFDEGHRLKDPKSAVTRRVKRYLEESDDVPVVIMSGTVTSRRLHDYWHILRWTHGNAHMPMPAHWPEMTEWSECLDVHASALKTGIGALRLMFTDEEWASVEDGQSEVSIARKVYQKRLTETHGVVSTVEDKGVNCSLYVRAVDPLKGDKSLDHLFTQMRKTWETPDGHPFSEAIAMWRHARELVAGFYYVWDPRPPKEWLQARRGWTKFVRGVLKHSHHLDTEMQVAKACAQGKLSAEVVEVDPIEGRQVVDVYLRWQGVKDTFKPRVKARWVSDITLKYAHRWMQANSGIVWVEHEAFGQRLSQEAGRPYFGEGGRAADGSIIELASGPVIASVHANRQGRNLQKWSKNLVISETPHGGRWQQLIARTHRDGQTADEVTFDVVVSCVEQWAGMMNALRDARYIYESTGDPQKLLIGNVALPTADDIAELDGQGRWTKLTSDGGSERIVVEDEEEDW